MKQSLNTYINTEHSFDKITMFGIICLLIVISGIFGWIYESIFYFFNGGMTEFYWKGGSFLPWINIYAIGAILIYFFTYRHRAKPFKVFIISFFLSGILEYFSGLLIYKLGNGLRYWDYNVEILNFGNIDGFICLRSLLFFGISSLFLIYLMIPLCFYIAKKLKKKTFLIMSIFICSIFLIDEIYNSIICKIFSLPGAHEVYKNLGFKFIKLK